MELFNREEALTSREEIKKLIENFDMNKKENVEASKEFLEKFESVFKEIENMKKTIQTDMNEVYEGKLHTWVEKLKKQNQELWEESLKHVKTDFKEIGFFFFNYVVFNF